MSVIEANVFNKPERRDEWVLPLWPISVFLRCLSALPVLDFGCGKRRTRKVNKMNNMKIKNTFIALCVAGVSAVSLFAQAGSPVAPAFQSAVSDITNIAQVSGTLIGGLVGLIGLGRTAWKLVNGDSDVMNSLIMAIIGIFLGAMANTFL